MDSYGEKTVAESSPEKKKDYRSPRLIVYGNIREITRNVGSAGMMDAVIKTQPF